MYLSINLTLIFIKITIKITFFIKKIDVTYRDNYGCGFEHRNIPQSKRN